MRVKLSSLFVSFFNPQKVEKKCFIYAKSSGKEKRILKLCAIQRKASEILGEIPLFVSQGTIRRHKTRHPEIDTFDYSLIPFMLENFQSIYQDDKRGVKYLLISRFGRFYRLSLKSLKDKDEVWVESLSSASDDKSLKNNLKNKRLVYEQDARKL